MPRTRDIKPGFFKNEDLAQCSPLARILFEGLWCWADRAGRIEDRPQKLKIEILPYDKCDIETLLKQLEQFNFIIRYEAEGKRCIWIPTFTQNQRIHPKEPDSALPGYSRDLPRQNVEIPGNSDANRTIPSSPSFPTKPSLPPTPKGDCERFDEFWFAYPKRQDKAKAKTIWQRDKLDAIAPAIIDAVQRFTQTPQWQAENFRYVPKPTTFLNGKRWEDELTPEANKTKAQTRAEVMLAAWQKKKQFRLRGMDKSIQAESIEPFNHLSQRVSLESPTAFRSKATGNVEFFTEFEVIP
jgi:hypothetical protein